MSSAHLAWGKEIRSIEANTPAAQAPNTPPIPAIHSQRGRNARTGPPTCHNSPVEINNHNSGPNHEDKENCTNSGVCSENTLQSASPANAVHPAFIPPPEHVAEDNHSHPANTATGAAKAQDQIKPASVKTQGTGNPCKYPSPPIKGAKAKVRDSQIIPPENHLPPGNPVRWTASPAATTAIPLIKEASNAATSIKLFIPSPRPAHNIISEAAHPPMAVQNSKRNIQGRAEPQTRQAITPDTTKKTGHIHQSNGISNNPLPSPIQIPATPKATLTCQSQPETIITQDLLPPLTALKTEGSTPP